MKILSLTRADRLYVNATLNNLEGVPNMDLARLTKIDDALKLTDPEITSLSHSVGIDELLQRLEECSSEEPEDFEVEDADYQLLLRYWPKASGRGFLRQISARAEKAIHNPKKGGGG